MTSTEAHQALTSRTDIRISRHAADMALISAERGGYYGIDGQNGLRVEIRFDANGFHISS